MAACPTCGFLASNLDPYDTGRDATSAIDEPRRAAALKRLRAANFERIIAIVAGLGASGRRLLDVGCGHGWFLEAACQAGYDAMGIEPDVAMQRCATRSGHQVWRGFFPDDVPSGEAFDVVVFNDVLEHLPDVAAKIRACRNLLVPNGLLVVNLPSSDGIFYRLADGLDRCGLPGPFERLWQKNFPSPHLSYFNPGALERLARRYGFREETRKRVPAVRIQGLWQRLRYDRTTGRFVAALQYAATLPLVLVAGAMPADTVVQVFRRSHMDAATVEAGTR